jgi:transposase
MNSYHLGIDVSKLKLDVCLLMPNDSHSASFDNSIKGFRALHKWLIRFNHPVCICMEATGTYSLPVAHFLHQLNIPVSIVNPLAVHHFARTIMSRNKTDSHDANLIARFSLKHNPRLWIPPSSEKRTLQELVRTREKLVEMRVLAQQHLGEAPASTVSLFKAQLRLLDKQIEQLQKDLLLYLKDNPSLGQAVALLTSIPGIATITAVTILAVMPEIDQLDSARQLAAFAGVTPAQKQSGSWTGKTRLSKLGHSRMRKALYFPASTALRHNPRAKALAIRLAQKGKGKMVIIGATMRLLTHLIYGVLKNRTPFNPEYQKLSATS